MRQLARKYDVELMLDGGGSHEKWLVGTIPVAVPRHKEITEGTARTILKRLEGQLAEQAEKRSDEGA
jgi:hypothetical protein